MSTVQADAPAIRESLRAGLRERVTEGVADEAVSLLMDAMRSTKVASGYCKTCRTTVSVQVQDARAASVAFETLIANTEGKATVAQDEAADTLMVVRTVTRTVDADRALTLLEAGDLDMLRLELLSSRARA